MMDQEIFLVLDRVCLDKRLNESKLGTVEFTVNVRDIVCYGPFEQYGAAAILDVKEHGPVHIVQTPHVIQQMLTEVGCMLCIRTE